MELDTKGKLQEEIPKLKFKLKSKPKDGVILQVHNTIRKSNGEIRRVRFVTACFNDANERLACADHSGNIFILDLSHLKFWNLSDIGPCSAMHFVPESLDMLVIGLLKDPFHVCFVDTETGVVSTTLVGHSATVKCLSFSSTKVCNLITASISEAFIWELKNYTKYFTLNTLKGAPIQQILFTPVSDKIVACFQNDYVQIWRQDTLESVKQIVPSALKHIKSIAFTMNGRAMAMAGSSPVIILFSLDTWKELRTLDLSKNNVSTVKQIAFVPQVFDGGSNKTLAVLSNHCVLHLYDLEISSVVYSVSPETSCIRKFTVSPTGKYFGCILQLGEVNIYNSLHVMDMVSHVRGDNAFRNASDEQPSISNVRKDVAYSKSNDEIKKEEKLRDCLDRSRLRRILSQYGEYPEQYRTTIWKALLEIPCNKTAYISLVNKPVHPSYEDIEQQFTIHSTLMLKSLKRLLSCLAHWCPLFAVLKFLPGFVFPFVRVLHKDPILLFECVLSTLINYCQLWFEYAPLPPINVLGMIENVLGEHDKKLLDHFCKCGVTSQIYALKILETAFSEVLCATQWLILWDHILSNEPSFILFAVVAYNITNRNALRKLLKLEDFDIFYRSQNSVDKKTFLKKCYILMHETSEDVHPRKFLNSFVSMEKGDCYPQFTGYPKATVSLKVPHKDQAKVPKVNKSESLRSLTSKAQVAEVNKKLKDLSICNVSSDDTLSDKSSGETSQNESFSEEEIPSCRKPCCHPRNTDDIAKKTEHFLREVVGCENDYTSTSDKRVFDDQSSSSDSVTPQEPHCRKPKKNLKAQHMEREIEKLMKKLSQARQ